MRRLLVVTWALAASPGLAQEVPTCAAPSAWSSILKRCVGPNGTAAPVENAPKENAFHYVREVDKALSGRSLVKASAITAGAFGATLGRETGLWAPSEGSRVTVGLLTAVGVFFVPAGSVGFFFPVHVAPSVIVEVVPSIFEFSVHTGVACGLSVVAGYGYGQRMLGSQLFIDAGLQARLKGARSAVWFDAGFSLLLWPGIPAAPIVTLGVAL